MTDFIHRANVRNGDRFMWPLLEFRLPKTFVSTTVVSIQPEPKQCHPSPDPDGDAVCQSIFGILDQRLVFLACSGLGATNTMLFPVEAQMESERCHSTNGGPKHGTNCTSQPRKFPNLFREPVPQLQPCRSVQAAGHVYTSLMIHE